MARTWNFWSLWYWKRRTMPLMIAQWEFVKPATLQKKSGSQSIFFKNRITFLLFKHFSPFFFAKKKRDNGSGDFVIPHYDVCFGLYMSSILVVVWAYGLKQGQQIAQLYKPNWESCSLLFYLIKKDLSSNSLMTKIIGVSFFFFFFPSSN